MKPCALLLVALIAFFPFAHAQESRGTISGTVTDPQGAVVPGAAVHAVNADTNVSLRAVTNETGFFEISLLNPGVYSVMVEAGGFKKSVRSGLQLEVAGRLELRLALELGPVADVVEVTSEAPLLDIANASGGRVITTREVEDLPFANNNPFGLAVLAAGVQWTGNPEARDLSANEGTSKFNTMGGVGPNEYSIDGAPDTGTKGRVGFIPPSQAVSEFKLEISPFDASYGRSAGATMNVVTKNGTNTYHGSVYDQHWQQRLNAMPHFSRLAYEDQVRRGLISPDTPKQDPGRSNNFGTTMGGPVRIPWLYNGTNRLFFFANYNGIFLDKTDAPANMVHTVPRMSWRQGDFSDLLAMDKKYQVYDPRTARLSGTRVIRDPFPGNRNIPVFNPMYSVYEKLYPKPNDVPGVASPEGLDNYYAWRMPVSQRFHSVVNRYDYNLSDRQRLFGRLYWNHHFYNAEDWTYETAPRMQASGKIRINKGAGGNYNWTIGNASLLDVGLTYTRFSEGACLPARTKYHAVDVGLPAYIDEKAGRYYQLPDVRFNNIDEMGGQYPNIPDRGAVGEFKATLSTVRGNHSLRYGWQERRYWFTYDAQGSSAGRFTFGNNYLKAADSGTTSSQQGLEWAAFGLGLPTQILIPTSDTGMWTTRNRAIYIQDDWRLSARLRLNLGLRYEREGGITERFNRGISGEFIRDMKQPFTDLVRAAYAANPLPEVPASQFQVLGATRYLGVNGPRTFTGGTHHLLPRAGVVFQLNRKTVLRAGYGGYYDTLNVNSQRANQSGYSVSSITQISNDNGLTFCCGVGPAANLGANNNPMMDPFPLKADGTRFETTYGNKLGGAALAGQGFREFPRDYSPAWQQRWRVGVQREITLNTVVEVSYNGAFARIPMMPTLSYLPEQYWSKGNVRNQAVDDELTRSLPNPFNLKNLAPLQATDPLLYKWLSNVGLFTGTTIRKNTLLRAFPHMTNVSGVLPGRSFADIRGATSYHDLQAQMVKRFSHGFQSAVMYTRAYSESQDYYMNEFDEMPTWRPNNNVRPNRLVWSAIYQLPFGKGKPFAKTGIARKLAGGWQLSWIYQVQDGPAVNWGKLFYYGDLDRLPKLLDHDGAHARDIHTWFSSAAIFTGTGAIPADFQGFEGRSAMQPASFQVRTFPATIGSLRADGIKNWDVKMMRRFDVFERLKAAVSVDMLDATNHTNFAAPPTDPTNKNFGKVSVQNGLGRMIQFNLKLEF